MAERKKGKGNAIVWALLGLLILSLGGFGIGGFGGSVRSVASVGDEEVSTADYARALSQERARLSQATGQDLSLEQLRLFGIDRQVMDRLLSAAAMAHEAGTRGVSVGDAEVARRIRASPAFQGVGGGFDRDAYAFVLERSDLSEADFEARIRDEAAQEILQAAVVGGADAPPGYAEAIAAWVTERRDVTVAEVGQAMLDAGAVAPTEAELAAYLEGNAARFETPERRRITYAWADVDAIAAALPADEARVAALYEARADDYRLPARVLAERLAFADAEAAAEARAAVEAGETTFEALVEDRGLSLADVDQGEIAAADVSPAEAEALFALDGPGLAGPVETPLGPALFRVNAVLDARETPLEAVRDELAREAATEAAVAQVRAGREAMDDALAGGATLEELAEEQGLTLGTLAWDPSVSEGLAGYEAFRAAAAALEEGDFPEPIELADGGLVALRLDGIDPAALPPLEEVRVEVEAAWQSDSLRDRLAARAAALAERLRAGEAFADLGLAPRAVTGLARDGDLPDGPRDLVDAIFEAEAGDVLAEAGDSSRAYVIRVDAVTPAAAEDADLVEALEQLRAQARAEVAQDLFAAFAAAAREDAGYAVDAAAVQAVEAQLLGGP